MAHEYYKLDSISRYKQRENLYKKSMFLPAFGSKKHIKAIMQKMKSILFSKKGTRINSILSKTHSKMILDSIKSSNS